jgi:hypothetical protein
MSQDRIGRGNRSLDPVGVTYELRFPDGADAGTFETNVYDWQVGDVFHANGNRVLRITAIVPVATMGEFIDTDDDMNEVWEVEEVEQVS